MFNGLKDIVQSLFKIFGFTYKKYIAVKKFQNYYFYKCDRFYYKIIAS